MINNVRILEDGKTALIEAVNKATIDDKEYPIYAWVDTDLLSAIAKFKAWRAVASNTTLKARAKAGDLGAYYFHCRTPNGLVALHQVVVMASDPNTVLNGFCIDHKNGYSLDNRKRNLQVVTTEVNVGKQRLDDRPRKTNKTGVRNVSLNAKGQFCVSVASKHRGVFETLQEASMMARHYREEANIERTGRP